MKIYTLEQIETPRLIIRPMRLGDEEQLSEAIQRSLPELQRWMPWAKNYSFQSTREFVERADYSWRTGRLNDFPMVAIDKVSRRIISASGFNEKSDLSRPLFEIGYWIDQAYQGQGLVTELVNALTRYALAELKATRVQIATQADNQKSIAVAQRCGYALEATMKNGCIDCRSGQPADSLLYACCDVQVLPELAVSWTHKPVVFEPEDLEALPVKPAKDKVALPELTTERLTLLPPRMQDTAKLYDALMASLNEVSPWFSWARADLKLEDLQLHIQEGVEAGANVYTHDHLFYIVWYPNQHHLLGEVWLKILDWSLPNMMVSYWFNTRQTGRGYAMEAVGAVIRYAFFELKAKRVQLHASQENSKSQRLARRLGFMHEGTLNNYCPNFVTGEVTASELFAMNDLSALKLPG